jgi:hypothetical protein
MHPPARAASYVRAVFAAARAVLPRDVVLEIEGRLPEDLAGLFQSAR